MNKLAKILADYVVKKGVVKQDEYKIYVYGFQTGLEQTIFYIISLIIALYFHVLLDYILFLGVFIPLRSFAGGIHLNHYLSCLLTSVITLYIILYIAANAKINNLVSVGIFLSSLIMIKILAPVRDVKRPISKGEEKYFNKKLNLSLIIFTLVMAVFYVLQFDKWLLLESLTVLFMVGVLIIGEFKYRRCLKKIQNMNEPKVRV